MAKRLKRIIVSWSFILIPGLYLILTTTLHTGYKEGYSDYFVNTAFLSLLLVTFTTKSFFTHLWKSFLGLFLIAWVAGLFWGYMDHPWFAGPETNSCDGPCYGWFSFENDSPAIFIAIVGIPCILFTGSIKAVILYIRKRLPIIWV